MRACRHGQGLSGPRWGEKGPQEESSRARGAGPGTLAHVTDEEDCPGTCWALSRLGPWPELDPWASSRKGRSGGGAGLSAASTAGTLGLSRCPGPARWGHAHRAGVTSSRGQWDSQVTPQAPPFSPRAPTPGCQGLVLPAGPEGLSGDNATVRYLSTPDVLTSKRLLPNRGQPPRSGSAPGKTSLPPLPISVPSKVRPGATLGTQPALPAEFLGQFGPRGGHLRAQRTNPFSPHPATVPAAAIATAPR